MTFTSLCSSVEIFLGRIFFCRTVDPFDHRVEQKNLHSYATFWRGSTMGCCKIILRIFNKHFWTKKQKLPPKFKNMKIPVATITILAKNNPFCIFADFATVSEHC